jgi:hypothetical protein
MSHASRRIDLFFTFLPVSVTVTAGLINMQSTGVTTGVTTDVTACVSLNALRGVGSTTPYDCVHIVLSLHRRQVHL